MNRVLALASLVILASACSKEPSSKGGSGGAGGAGGMAGKAGSGGKAGQLGSGGAAGKLGSGGTAGAAGATDAGADATAGSGGAKDAGLSTDAALTTVTKSPCPTDGTACKIMPFGDSITNGALYGGAYRVRLFHDALSGGKKITFVGSQNNGPGTVDGVAFPSAHEGWYGWAIDPYGGRSGVSTKVSTVMPAHTPHIVLMMIGTNDCIDNHELATAPTRLGNLIDSIYTYLPDALIVVAQIVPSQDDALNGRIQTYNAAIPAVVQARRNAGKNIAMVDHYTPFASVANYKTTLFGDTWHPTEAGYVIMGDVWYNTIASILK